MDGFTYTNIFETKGVEYIIIIAFLILIIPFWLAITKKSVFSKRMGRVFGVLSANILRVPEGLYYSKNHTWAHLERSGIAKVGLDDFLLHITGEVKISTFKKEGDAVNKGDLIVELDQDGKRLKITSPISGKIKGLNSALTENPGTVNDDPYGKGWIYQIKPASWISETSRYYLAENAVSWSKSEIDRFKDFMATVSGSNSPEYSRVILQDGGELCDHPLSELPQAVWHDFQKSFLNQES